MDQQDEQEKQNAADEALDQEVRIVDVFFCCLRFHPFALTFTFYFLILRWAPPNSAYLFRLLVLRTWGSSYQKCHFGNRFIFVFDFANHILSVGMSSWQAKQTN